MEDKIIKKRFPATVHMDASTFLNNKKINGELYAFLQSLSYADENKQTVVYKNSLPTQKAICEKINVKSPKTYRSHLAYLIETGYLIEKEDKYVLPDMENIFLLIPLDTLNFICDTLNEQVIKIYIYLAQRYNYKKSIEPNACYEFTSIELAQHLGLKVDGNMRTYEIIDNALLCLQKLGLIDYIIIYEGKKPKKLLTKFSFEKPVK